MKFYVAAVFVALICLPKAGLSQRKVGVDWHPPAQISRAKNELNTFSKIGITYLQVHQKLPAAIWNRIDSLGFTVWGRLPVDFPIARSFAKSDSSHLRKMRKLAAYFSHLSAIKAIGVFAFADENDVKFKKRIRRFSSSIRRQTNKRLYYISIHAGKPLITQSFDFKMVSTDGRLSNLSDNTGAILYHPVKKNRWSVAGIKTLLQNTAGQPATPVFFPSGWLKVMLSKHPNLSKSLRLYSQTANPAFPLSASKSATDWPDSLSAGLLLLLWILFALTYNFSPLYRKSFLRYVNSHSFYVDDVMQGHIRGYSIGFSILLQHALAGGIAGYCFFSMLFSPLAHKAILRHYPNAGLLGSGTAGFFLWTFLILLLAEGLTILWLWLAAPGRINLSQVLNLYPWALQVNLLTSTLIAAFYLSGQPALLTYVSTGVFVLILLEAFVISCFDITAYIQKRQNRYLTATLGVLILLAGGLAVWVATSTKFLEVAHLALSLSR